MLNSQQKEKYQKLGIPINYGEQNNLPFFPEASDLVDAGPNLVGKMQKLTLETALNWNNLLNAASKDKISLLIVSGYRSFDYQIRLIEKKLEKGMAIQEILMVNAPPGYSQHHAGIAIDIATLGMPPLTEQFDSSDAFLWLDKYAKDFNFMMPYTKKNTYGFIYEPWHWVCNK